MLAKVSGSVSGSACKLAVVNEVTEVLAKNSGSVSGSALKLAQVNGLAISRRAKEKISGLVVSELTIKYCGLENSELRKYVHTLKYLCIL